MDSQIWGPYFWFTLHTITLAYPEKPTYIDRRHFHDFFLSLQHILPCQLCREHYKQHLQEYPVSAHLDSKESLVKWCFFLHNKVNFSLGKPNFSYEEFREKYMRIYVHMIVHTNMRACMSVRDHPKTNIFENFQKGGWVG